ncbi:MAG: hypothetical protein HYX67_04565 [Candidatus Melainabacteria bacterium]|nr:hypothetical protein [Candidatus Melainabacteria bacterium]
MFTCGDFYDFLDLLILFICIFMPIFLSGKTNNLSELIYHQVPLRKQGELEKYSRLYSLFITALESAVHEFSAGNLVEFDALVGENACELRAACVVDLWDEYSQGPTSSLAKEISSLAKRIEDVKGNMKSLKFEKGKAGYEILKQNQLDVELSTDLVFLTLAHLLKKCSVNGDITNPELLLEWNKNIEKNSVKRVVDSAQQRLSELSIVYLQMQADQIQDPQLKWLAGMVAPPFILKDSVKRLTCPMFFSLWIIYQRMLEKGQRVLLEVQKDPGKKREYALFQPKEGKYVLTDLSYAPNKAAMVWSGFQKGAGKEEIPDTSLFDIFMMNNAQHPQYSSEYKTQEINWGLVADPIQRQNLKSQFENWKKTALQSGCHKENQSLFYIEHSFCTHLQKIEGERNVSK